MQATRACREIELPTHPKFRFFFFLHQSSLRRLQLRARDARGKRKQKRAHVNCETWALWRVWRAATACLSLMVALPGRGASRDRNGPGVLRAHTLTLLDGERLLAGKGAAQLSTQLLLLLLLPGSGGGGGPVPSCHTS